MMIPVCFPLDKRGQGCSSDVTPELVNRVVSFSPLLLPIHLATISPSVTHIRSAGTR